MILIRRGMFFPAFLLFLVFRVAAQQPADTAQRLDTVVADTVVVGVVAPPTSEASLDTSNLNGAGGDVDAGPAVLRSVPDSAVTGWKKSPRFAYANDPAYWRHARPKDNSAADRFVRFLMSNGFRYFLYFLLAGVLVFVIIRVMSDMFYRKRKISSIIEGDEEEKAEEDADKGLEKALANGDHRRATRYLYLRTLRLLSERGLIRLRTGATNHEYLQQLAGGSREAAFRFLTLAYEKVWYGDFSLGEPQFRRLYQHFEDFDKTVQV